jgi:branched-chain amino acid transport system ATP-binding protein
MAMAEEVVDAALRIENIEVVYHHTFQVLRGLSLHVPKGAMVALLGSNGAGKTTTLKAVSGLLPLEKGEVRSGEIWAANTSLNGMAPHLIARSGIAHVREGRHVFEDLTVEENLIAATLALKGRVGAAKPDFDRLFEYFPRLAERRQQRAGYLSGGEQQMLAISRALVGQPNLILLDEPSLGLAPKVVEEIFAIIARINREQGVAMLLVEQNAFAAFGICSQAYIMENGKVVVSGPVERLRNDADVQRFYLGYSEGASEVASFRDVKHYKRRKRWLS